MQQHRYGSIVLLMNSKLLSVKTRSGSAAPHTTVPPFFKIDKEIQNKLRSWKINTAWAICGSTRAAALCFHLRATRTTCSSSPQIPVKEVVARPPRTATAVSRVPGDGRARKRSLSWRSDQDSTPNSRRPTKRALCGIKSQGTLIFLVAKFNQDAQSQLNSTYLLIGV